MLTPRTSRNLRASWAASSAWRVPLELQPCRPRLRMPLATLPIKQNDLRFQDSGASAVEEAYAHVEQANGCYFCPKKCYSPTLVSEVIRRR